MLYADVASWGGLMEKLSFEPAAEELSKLYAAAEPSYARHLSRELFDLLRRTHELAFVFKGYPPEIAANMALEKAQEATGQRGI
jgi:hypothetical protein